MATPSQVSDADVPAKLGGGRLGSVVVSASTSASPSSSPRTGGAVASPVSVAAAASNGAARSPPPRSGAAVVSARALAVEVAPVPSNAALFEEFLEFRSAKLEVQGAPPLVVDPQPGCAGCGRPLPVRCPGCAAGRVSADWRGMSAPAFRGERTDGSLPTAREGREEKMAARWTQQQQQQQQWRQPGQVGMVFGRGGGVGMAAGGGGQPAGSLVAIPGG